MEKFSFDTIKDFDRHIELSIPNYTHIHELIKSMSTYFIKPKTNIYDIGCSTGKLINDIALTRASTSALSETYVGYEVSENFNPPNLSAFSMVRGDLTKPEETPIENSSLVLSIFTLQFLPASKRWQVVKRIYDGLIPGGALIVCEKVYCKEGFVQDLFTFSYYDYKKKTFTEKEILDKQKDLREIMQPFTEDQNKVMFKDCGFKFIDTFFTSLMFKGWVMVK